jgi:hypothetical protein
MKEEKKQARDFGNIKRGWVLFDGDRWYFMRSKMEMNYGRYLDFLKSKREIKDWRYEPPAFWFKGIKSGSMSYKPDFEITHNNDSLEYVETKGFLDSKSITKLRRMKRYFPKVKLRYIDKTAFKTISKWKKVIPKWIYPHDTILKNKPDSSTILAPDTAAIN